jgi:microcystin-dependent protein
VLKKVAAMLRHDVVPVARRGEVYQQASKHSIASAIPLCVREPRITIAFVHAPEHGRHQGTIEVAEAYLGEIRMFAFGFAPRGWALCNGQLMAIAQNQAVFALLGTTYGGNGVQTFALPDMRSRAPLHVGQGTGLTFRTQGEIGGEESHTLTINELPQHTHLLQAAVTPTTGTPGASVVLAAPTSSKLYRSGGSTSANPNPASVAPAGGNQPHPNLQPYTVVSFAICLQGIFPSRN